MIENICHFVPYHKDYHSIQTINFVYETKNHTHNSLLTQAFYSMYYVCSGSGYIHTMGKIQPIKPGYIFFTFPSFPFMIEAGDDFRYMYISFIGTRANMIMEKLNISKQNFVFNNCSEIEDIWKKGIDTKSEISDITSESILLYTFSFLGNRYFSSNTHKNQNNTVLKIKKYIDDNFSNGNFSLKALSDNLCYNQKYISSVFKKEMGIGIIEYLNTIRIQQACELIKQGFTSISDISNYCGYSDPQYFSKIFKQKLGMAPGIYIRSLKKS